MQMSIQFATPEEWYAVEPSNSPKTQVSQPKITVLVQSYGRVCSLLELLPLFREPKFI